jgi:hypothetical protein
MDFYAGQVVRGGRSGLEGVAEDEAIYRHEYVDGSLTSRKRIQVATVATANKMARMARTVLTKEEAYRPPLLPETTCA